MADQFDAALLERPARVGNQPLGIERVDLPQAAALGTHPLRTVEAEQLRAGRLEAQAAVRAGVVGGEGEGERGRGERGRAEDGECLIDVERRSILDSCSLPLSPLPSPPLPSFLHRHHEIPLAQPQRQLHGFGQSRPHLRPGHEPIDHDLDVVPHLTIEPQVVAQVDHAAIDPCAGESLLQQIGEQIAMLAFLAADAAGPARETACRRAAPRSGRGSARASAR